MHSDIVIFGSLLLDRYFEVDRWPARGQDGYFNREETFVGGCAINMAATIHNLGGAAHVVSCVGQDETGALIRDYLTKHGLSSALLHPAEGVTGSCLVFSEPDGERTFLTRVGVEERFPYALAEKAIQITPAWAGVTGYFLLGSDGARVMDCLERLHEAGTKVLFDPSPLAGDIPQDILQRVLAVSDILTPNETELSLLGGDGAIPSLVQAGKTLVLKRGSQGGTVYDPEETFDYASVLCEAVDTTGAGDSFSGALLHAMIQNMPLKQAIELAARCAAKTVQVHGPHGFWKLEE